MVFDFLEIKKQLFLIGDEHAMEMECIQIKENSKRFQYGEHVVKKYANLFKFDRAAKSEHKSDLKSNSFRVEGNNFFKRGKYEDAITAYNKSLRFAISDENFAIGYANRSAVYFQIRRYFDCRENIVMARKYENLPNNLKVKLIDRATKCENKGNPIKIKEMRTPNGQTRLSYDKDCQIPFVVNRVGLKKVGSNVMLYAKDFLELGAVIIKEKVISKFFMLESRFSCCHFCYKRCYNLIPCPNCTCAMFCNEECMNRANDEFHKWECPAMDLLLFLDNDVIWMSFRLLLKMLKVFRNYSELENYWKLCVLNENDQVNWYSINVDKYDSIAHFRVFHSNKPKDSNDVVLTASYTAAFFKIEIMKYHKDLQKIFETEEQKSLFGEVILYHMLSFIERQRIVKGDFWETTSDGKESDIIFTTLIQKELQFSKTPNVFYHWEDEHKHYIASRPILKGELLMAPPEEEELGPGY